MGATTQREQTQESQIQRETEGIRTAETMTGEEAIRRREEQKANEIKRIKNAYRFNITIKTAIEGVEYKEGEITISRTFLISRIVKKLFLISRINFSTFHAYHFVFFCFLISRSGHF